MGGNKKRMKKKKNTNEFASINAKKVKFKKIIIVLAGGSMN